MAKTTSISFMIGGMPVPVPIRERSDVEPMAILLIRLITLIRTLIYRKALLMPIA